MEVATGAVRWRTRVSGDVRVAPASSAGELVVADGSSTLTGLDAGNGDQRWTAAVEAPVALAAGAHDESNRARGALGQHPRLLRRRHPRADAGAAGSRAPARPSSSPVTASWLSTGDEVLAFALDGTRRWARPGDRRQHRRPPGGGLGVGARRGPRRRRRLAHQLRHPQRDRRKPPSPSGHRTRRVPIRFDLDVLGPGPMADLANTPPTWSTPVVAGRSAVLRGLAALPARVLADPIRRGRLRDVGWPYGLRSVVVLAVVAYVIGAGLAATSGLIRAQQRAHGPHLRASVACRGRGSGWCYSSSSSRWPCSRRPPCTCRRG